MRIDAARGRAVSAEALRAAMVDRLRGWGGVRSPQAASALTTTFDPRHAFGIRHHHHGATSDDPGLLTGAAGAALALADYGDLPQASTVITRWDALLLLS